MEDTFFQGSPDELGCDIDTGGSEDSEEEM